MKNSSFKSKPGKFLLGFVACIAMTLGTVSASQQADQIAIQLGGIKLKVDVNNPKTSDGDIARAIVQGRAMLESTASKSQPGVANQPFAAGEAQTAETRAMILEATQKALSSPVTRTIARQAIPLSNGRTVTAGATLNPQLTTASAIAAIALKQDRNAAAEITKSAVAAATKLVNDKPVFRAAGSSPAKIHESQMQDAAKIAGFAFDSLQGSNALGISPAAAAIATGALNGLGSGAQTDSDVSALIQSMVENALYTFQYAPARLLAGIPNFVQNSVPGKSGFVDPVLNAEASSVLEGIVKGAVGFTQKTSSQAHSQQAGAEDVAKNLDPEKNDGGGADSGTVATLALRVTAGGRGAGPLANISLVDMVARAVSRGIVNSYLAACRSANATPMTWLQLQEACRLAILNAYTALGLTVPVETFIGQVVQQMMLQNQQYRDLVKQVQGQDEAINGAGNPNLSGVGQNVGMARPVTDTVGR